MRRVFSVLLCLLLSFSLCAIGFGYHVLDIRTEVEFAKGIFPSSLYYQFNFPMPDIIGGSSTLLAFSLDNGLVYRYIRQDPSTGKLYSKYSDLDPYTSDKERSYTVQFDEFNLVMSQGILNDMFTLSGSIGGRFEKAYERLFYLYDADNLSGAFYSSPGVERFSDWSAYPDLGTSRSAAHTFYNIGFDFDLYKDKITRKDGIKVTSAFRSTVPLGNILDGDNGDKVDFRRVKVGLSAAKTLFSIDKADDMTWFSVVIGTDAEYRFVWGDKIPQYVIGGDLYGVTASASNHLITDRTYINIYGPEIKLKDFYPYISLFHDFAYSFGTVINNGEAISDFAASFGFKAEYNIFNLCNLFYEIGYVYKNPFTDAENKIEATFGFSVGV